MLRPTGLNHVGLLVTNMERTLEFYGMLGFELLRTSGPNAEGVRSAVMKIGGQEINLFSGMELVSADGKDLKGLHHFAVDMDADSIDTLIAELRKVGLDIVRGPEKRRDGISVFVADPDGVRVELRVPR